MSEIWYISEVDLAIRLLISAVLGGLIGLEREWSNHAAGLRTHILVCLGSTAIMLLSMYGFSAFLAEPNVRADPARLAAQVISGIGFLGAGAILRTGSTISGLTTAASIWVVAAIGLCVGAGFFYCAGITTLIVLIILILLNKMEQRWMSHRRNREIAIRVADRPGNLGQIAARFGAWGIQIANVQMKADAAVLGEAGEPVYVEFIFKLKPVKGDVLLHAMNDILSTVDISEWRTDIWQAVPKVGAIVPEAIRQHTAGK